jgi:hypothetical protein
MISTQSQKALEASKQKLLSEHGAAVGQVVATLLDVSLSHIYMHSRQKDLSPSLVLDAFVAAITDIKRAYDQEKEAYTNP